MTVSISWLLQQRHLALTLLAGPRNASREIQFAQATELVDPTPWLSGGELVLTTGLGFTGDTAEFAHYVRALDSVGVAAVAFGTGLSHAGTPTALIDAARTLGLPLIEVPLKTPFAAVTRAVMARLAEQEYEQVLRAAGVQTKITRAALRGGVAAIVRELAIATTMSVAFVDARDVTVHPPTDSAFADQVRAAVAEQGHRGGAASISVSTPHLTLTVQPVGVGASMHGYLAIGGSGPLGNIDRVLLGHAVSLLTLELEKPVRLRAERTRLNTIAVGLLLDGRFSPDEIPPYLHDAADDRGRIRVVAFGGASDEKLLRHLDTAFTALGRTVFVLGSSTETVLLLRGTDNKAAVQALVAGLPVSTAKRIRSGISAVHPIADARQGLDQARMAANLANAEARVLEFESFSGSTLLASAPARDALLAIASMSFPVLERHDETHHSSLVASLRAYLEANGQWESAASELGVHRHTLRGRIARIEELLGCELSQARVRAELLLALLAWESR